MRTTIFIFFFLCFLGLPLIAQGDLNDGLVGYYPFDGNVKDYSGNGYDGDIQGNVTFVNGKIGKAVKFDNYPEMISLPKALLNGTNSTTVSFWLKIDKPDIRAGIISASNSQHDNEYLIFLSSGTHEEETSHIGHLKYHFNIQGESNDFGKYKVNDGKFHLITIVTTPSGAKCYVDGKLDAVINKNIEPFDIESKIWLGNDQDCVDDCWEETQQLYGEIDDLRFYNRALSEDEIKELYIQGNGGCSDEILKEKYNEGFEAGKKFCQEHPSECGITCGGESTPSITNTNNCATFDFINNVLYVPCFTTGTGDSYWLEFKLTNTNPVSLELKNAGENK